MSPVGVVLACTLAEIAELEALRAQLELDAKHTALLEHCDVNLARLVERAHHEWAALDEACRDQEQFLALISSLGTVH